MHLAAGRQVALHLAIDVHITGRHICGKPGALSDVKLPLGSDGPFELPENANTFLEVEFSRCVPSARHSISRSGC